jgi:asparagine synthetase B (glutamine-hydrolysing)
MLYHRPLSGAHPLYYIENWPAQGNLLFASELKALLALGVPRRLHFAALDALSRYGFIPAPWTLFKDIHTVPAGSILRWQHAKTLVNPATNYHLDELPKQHDALDHLYSQLAHATSALLPSHDQLAALFNGDDASILVTLLAAQHTQAPFTLAILDYNHASNVHKDVERVAASCHRPGLAVTAVDDPAFWIATLTALEAPSVDTRPLALHQLLHTVAAETGARTVLSGLGASTVCGVGLAQALGESEQQDILARYSQTLVPPQQRMFPLWSQEAASMLRREESWEKSLHARKLARQAARISDKQRRQYYLDLHLRLPDLVVGPAQQLATQERIAIRSPYLSKDVLDTLTRLPALLPDGTRKEHLSTTLLHRHQSYRHSGTSHASLAVPTTSLLRIDTSDLLRQTLSSAAIRATGLFDEHAVEELLKLQEVSRELLLVFTTQLVCQLFAVGM